MIPIKTDENYVMYLAIPMHDYYKFILYGLFEIEIVPMDIFSHEEFIQYQVSVKLTDASKKRDNRPRIRNKPWMEHVSMCTTPYIPITKTHAMRGVIVEYSLFVADLRTADVVIRKGSQIEYTDYVQMKVHLSNTDKVIHKYLGTTTFKEVPIGEEWYFDNPYNSMYL